MTSAEASIMRSRVRAKRASLMLLLALIIPAAFAIVRISVAIKEARLREAVERGDQREAVSLLEAGVDPTLTTSSGHSLLTFAVEFYQEELAKALLDRGASVRSRDSRGRSAAEQALLTPSTNITLLLLPKLAHSPLKTQLAIGGLYIACNLSDTSKVRSFLNQGVHPNTPWNGDRLHAGPPLVLAASNGNAELVRVLLEHGADVNLASSSGFTSLMAAANAANETIVRMLLEKKPKLSVRDKRGFTALGYALWRPLDNEEVIDLLTKAGCPL